MAKPDISEIVNPARTLARRMDDATNGPPCLVPATCASGTCKLPNPASCG